MQFTILEQTEVEGCKTMTSFLTVIATPAVRQAVEKSLLKKQKVSTGRLFGVIGYWVYQQGGLIGYALRDNPNLLAKLIAPPGVQITFKKAIEELYNWRKTLASELEQLSQKEQTFFHLYTLRELRSAGINLISWPPDKALEKAADESFIEDVMRISFIKGVSLGFIFPDKFVTMWENTFYIWPYTEWKEMYERGIVDSKVQPKRSLNKAISEISQAAIAWAAEEASGILNDQDVESLQRLIAENKDSQ